MDPEVLAEALTMAGFEVEEIEDRRTSQRRCPGKSDKRTPSQRRSIESLSGRYGAESTLNIVCGAPNVQKDLMYLLPLLAPTYQRLI